MRRMKLATSLCSEPRTNGRYKYAPSTAAQTRPALLALGSTWVAPVAHFPYMAFASSIARAKRWVARGVLVDAVVVFSGGASGRGGGRGRHAVEERRWKRGGEWLYSCNSRPCCCLYRLVLGLAGDL